MGFSVLYSIRDAKGSTSTSQVNLPTGLDFDNAVTFAGSMASLIDDLIGGQIVRVGIAFEVDLPGGLQSSPSASSDVEEGARFQFRTSGNHFTGIRIPTFLESFLQSGTKFVDTTATEVAAFVNAMISGIDVDPGAPVVVVAPSDTRDEDITSLDSALESFQSSR